ncbi:homocysteine-responsive endoplasmic reticulum-resident ubiquitin-like domain member 2 protein [Bombina bombina]|uniref:homocysteine-responsive endoplasmic reticulum-resident ubiquitin-like domain member 2 protein n=1 Tax=Bombina bombina TaxID=8345 RepID=UPI00235AAEF0|nr:homocysteine-responsive endoplasmic reticulum-resident ubiquitin-like domain member 2 protein [Bombina bombina]
MDQSTMDSPVTLVIKTPNQKYDDQTINCFLDWTVEKLKSHLSNVYPSKPSTKDQRLVYSGKLLLDHLRLKDVLRKQDEYHMVHLVCASRTPPSSPKASHNKERIASTSSSSSEHSGPASHLSSSQEMSATSSVPGYDENLRHRQTLPVSSNLTYSHPFSYLRVDRPVGNPLPDQGAPAVFPTYPVFSPLQMMWWQQIYARQYYMQYHASVSEQAPPESEASQPSPPPAINSPHPPPNPPRAVQNVVPQVNQNVQMNAQGGPVMNEEDINRDWLDWMYTVSRAAILLSVVYFYSSFSRFVMAVGAMILVYMHQAGWFPFRQEEGQQPARENAAAANHNIINNNELRELERQMDDGLQEDVGDENADNAALIQRPGLFASAWSFITTFFTSLIPEGPPHVAN